MRLKINSIFLISYKNTKLVTALRSKRDEIEGALSFKTKKGAEFIEKLKPEVNVGNKNINDVQILLQKALAKSTSNTDDDTYNKEAIKRGAMICAMYCKFLSYL